MSTAGQRMRAQGLWGRGQAKPEAVVQRLTAMQAQEHPYARWSVGQRCRAAVTAADVDRAFDDGRILRTHVLRPTWHYVTPLDARWLLALSGPKVDAGNARPYANLGLDAKTRSRAADVIAEAVAGASLTRSEIGAALDRKGIAAHGQRLAHLLMSAELHCVVCSGPMRAREHTYAAFDERVPPAPGPAGDEALAELARRYFTTRGPATLRDFCWWAGLRAAEARAGLDAASGSLVSRVLDGRTYWMAEDDGGQRSDGPRADLVQCYDEIVIAYRESRDALATPDVDFAVPRHLDGFAHVALLDGQLLGHWRARPRAGAAEVETRLARRLQPDEQRALDEAVARYERFAGRPAMDTRRSE